MKVVLIGAGFGIGALCNFVAIVYCYMVSHDHYRKNELGIDS
ncbi:MAG: hypothetical protein RR719_07850 [Akkermansia sp.]